MSDFSYEIGSDNIAVIKWDVPNKKFNVLTIEGIDEIEKILDELFENNGLKGVIITSNKDNFSAGMDLNVLAHLQDQSKNKEEISNITQDLSMTLGFPKERVEKDLKLYASNAEKLSQALELIKETLANEKRKQEISNKVKTRDEKIDDIQ